MNALGPNRMKVTISPLKVDYNMVLTNLKRVKISYSRFVGMCTAALADRFRRLPDNATDQEVRRCVDRVLDDIRCDHDEGV